MKSIKPTVGKEEVFGSFLRRGYLPEVFPPIFSSINWAAGVDSKNPEISLPDFDLQRISYSCTKRGYGRRYFDFVHPVSAVSTSAWLSRYWNSVETFCNSIETSPVDLELQNDADDRSVTSCSFDKVLQISKQRLAGARYIVRADVAKYYSSIYTHAIPWALHGKDLSKKDRSSSSKLIFGNELDMAIRIGQGNQTKGIPVGADFSRVVGEIIGAALDRAVLGRIDGNYIGYVRNIDDFCIGAKDLGAAEDILHALQESLRDFELELNDDKTSIKEASSLIDETWIYDLDSILGGYSRDTGRLVERAFDRAFQLANSSKSDSALKYLIRTVDRLTSAGEVNFSDVEHGVIRAMVSYPHCLDYCVLVFLKQNNLGNASAELWKETIKRELNRHLSLSHDHEASWLLTAVIGADIKLGNIDFNPDPNRQITNTLMFECLDGGLVAFNGNTILDEFLQSGDINNNWLLSNEVLANSWGTSAIRDRVSKEYAQVVGKNTSFIHSNFMSELEWEQSDRAIPDRYHRYDDGMDEDDDLLF
jgi:hypothetical protein